MRGRGLLNIIYDPSHMRVGNTHIFVNPGSKADHGFAKEIVKTITNKRNFKFHIFIFNAWVLDDENKDQFVELIKALIDNPSDMPKIVIHIPNRMSDIKVLCDYVLDEAGIPTFVKESRIKYALERRGCSFKIPRDPRTSYLMTFDYSYRSVEIKIEVKSFEFSGFDPSYCSFGGKPGAVKNLVQAVHPELFRDKIIAGFKESCPEGILKTFKTDDEIWEYITENGEWSVKEEK